MFYSPHFTRPRPRPRSRTRVPSNNTSDTIVPELKKTGTARGDASFSSATVAGLFPRDFFDQFAVFGLILRTHLIVFRSIQEFHVLADS